MRDEEEDRKRKGKGKADEMDDGDKRARTSSANMWDQWRGMTCIHCHRLYEDCVCPLLQGNRDNRGENAPPYAPVDNQPHGRRPMGQQSGVPSRFSSNPRQFVAQQQQLEQLEQRGQFASASAPQQIQIPGNNPPQYYSEAPGQHAAAAQQQQPWYTARPMFRPFSTTGAQQQQRLDQYMADLADVAGIQPQASYQTTSTTGAQQQQLRADMPPVGTARHGRPEIPDLNLPPAATAATSNAREFGIPGQNAAPQRLDIQTHPTPWQPGGLQWQWQAPRPPPPMARCPVCLSLVFYALYNNTICMVCVCGEAVRRTYAGPIPDDRRCSVCRINPGRQVYEPSRHVCLCAICHFYRGAVCLVCISGRPGIRPPQPRHQQNFANPAQNAPGSASAAVVNQPHGLPSTSRPGLQEHQIGLVSSQPLQLQQQPPGLLGSPSPAYVAYMANLAAESSGAAASRRIQLPLPPPLAYMLLVLGNTWCTACRRRPARKVFQPREHDCLCFTCFYEYRMMCPVCSFG